MSTVFSLTTRQLRFSSRFFFVPVASFKFVNNFNFVFLRFVRRSRFFISDLVLFDICIQRMQYFIKFLGYRGSSFLGVVQQKSNELAYYDMCYKYFVYVSKWFNKPLVGVRRYRPGLFTNWRSNIASLLLPKPSSYFSSEFVDKSSVEKFFVSSVELFRNTFKRRFKGPSLTFPSVLLTFDSFYTIYLFSEAERLGLPIIGPFSIYLNFSFWTYSYPVYMYSASNISFFIRLFSINYLKGRLNFLLLMIK